MPDELDSTQHFPAHPTLDAIRAFASGKLNGDSLHWIEQHISYCGECCTLLESIPTDTLAELLRTAPVKIEKSNLRLVAGYEIKEELGRGGMGVVYLATQPSLLRDVALKMISRGEQADLQDLSRFRKEGRAIASLHHPNIAQVYDVGDQAGQPYISMELVRGGTLANLLHSGPLSISDATRLMIQLTDAVAHAHSRGVIHRDLKPSNILLAHAKELLPKIVDFGLAKRTGVQESATLSGMLVGTPSYMSPEQASGKNDSVGETTDVYALGTILYEILIGRPPFHGSDAVAILEQVRSVEPIRPKSIRSEIPTDLETICLKCLEKSSARRYQTAVELHADLNCFAEGRPIQARPIGWSTRLLKWTRRHPALASMAGVVALAIVCMLTISLVYNRYLSEALKAAREERSRADTNFRYAFDAVERMLERVGFSELANQPGMETVREELLLDAVRLYSTLLAEHPDNNVDARRQYCVALTRLGRLQSMLGHSQESHDSLSRAVGMQEQLLAEFPNRNDIRHELAISHLNLALLDKVSNGECQIAIDLLAPIRESYPACRRELAEAMNLYSNTMPVESREQFHLEVLEIRKQLLLESPQDPHLQHGLGQTLHNLGHNYHILGQNEAAVRVLNEALDVFESLANGYGEVVDYQVSLAECTAILASIEHTNRQPAISEPLIKRSIDARKLLVNRYPKTLPFAVSLAHGYMTHAAFLIQLHDFAGAVGEAEAALRIVERLNKDFPSQEHQYLVTSTLTLLATALDGDRREQDSREVFEKGCEAYEELLSIAPDSPDYMTEAGVHFMNFSNLLRRDSPSKARPYNDRAVALLEKAYKLQPSRYDFRSYVFNANGALAQTLEQLNEFNLAADSWERAIELSDGERIREIRIARGIALARGASPQKASDAAEELISCDDLSGLELYNLACLYGLILNSAPDHPSARNRAFELLNRSECRLFLSANENLQQLKVDSDLTSIRSDERFQLLLDSLIHE